MVDAVAVVVTLAVLAIAALIVTAMDDTDNGRDHSSGRGSGRTNKNYLAIPTAPYGPVVGRWRIDAPTKFRHKKDY